MHTKCMILEDVYTAALFTFATSKSFLTTTNTLKTNLQNSAPPPMPHNMEPSNLLEEAKWVLSLYRRATSPYANFQWGSTSSTSSTVYTATPSETRTHEHASQNGLKHTEVAALGEAHQK